MGVFITILCFLPFPFRSASLRRQFFDLLRLLRKIKPATYLPTYLSHLKCPDFNLPKVGKYAPARSRSTRAVQLACEKGSSSWLNALPLVVHGFDLSKSAFRDAVSLRYGWEILPSTCACGAHFSPAHALELQCPTGGFTITRHNEVRDLLAESLREVSTNVSVEPTLLPLTGEHLRLRSATTDSDARLDIAASGFYGGRFEQALFDVRVFSPFASSNHSSLPAVYRRQEQEKRRKYGQRVREVEHASFVPLIFHAPEALDQRRLTF